MHEQTRLFPKKQFRVVWKLILLFLCLSCPIITFAEELYVEPIVQNAVFDDWIPVLSEHNTYYIRMEDLARILKIKTDTQNGLKGSFANHDFDIHIAQVSPQDYQKIKGAYYFSLPFYEKLLDIKMVVNVYEMQLDISAERELPITTARLLKKRQESFVPMPQLDTFRNYEFDNRFWSVPVVDLSFQKGFSFRDYNGAHEQKFNSTYYQADFGFLAGGFDAYGSIFGDNYNAHYNPRSRLTISRTFLDEPKNALNLTTFEAGDVTGFNSTLFNNSVSGRGAYASSFKDLVLSADKTIDINGPLSDGWQVELYQNNQLIGFRQSSIGGRYQFANVPVSYGLNTFKLVFYGPYGEILTEERNYYSGTSPVKTGEFGYVLNAYQRDRYLFEGSEPYVSSSDKTTLDFTGYYGLNDNWTLIGGMSQTPDIVTDESRGFLTAGAQTVLSGASIQYNLLYGLSNNAIGHHVDVQGNIYIGDVFARYDYYGQLRTPVSYYNGQYLKNIAEARLTGYIPWGGLPYYLSYLNGNYSDSGDKLQEIHARLSPSFWRYYNVSLENVWYKDSYDKYDDAVLLLQAQYERLGLHSQVRYRVWPDSYLASLNQQVDYRWSKYTYFQANWDHDCRSNYSFNKDLDTFSISAGRLFPIGGLTLTLSVDSDRNASVLLGYNISFGKVPGDLRAFTNAQNKMSQRAAVHARVTDEAGNGIEGVHVNVSGQQEPLITDKKGEFLVADMEPYAKTVVTVNQDSIEDVSLTPVDEQKKIVLRPGTVMPLELKFVHRGGFEGWINAEDAAAYRLTLYDGKGEKVMVKTAESDGSFIFDDLIFGTYKLVVSNESGQTVLSDEVKVDKAFETLKKPIVVADNANN